MTAAHSLDIDNTTRSRVVGRHSSFHMEVTNLERDRLRANSTNFDHWYTGLMTQFREGTGVALL